MLPHDRDPDSHIVPSQLHMFRGAPLFLGHGKLDREGLYFSSIYPHLIGRLAWLVDTLAPRVYPAPQAPLEVHLRAAGHDERLVRRVVAALSVGSVPGAYLLARHFVPAWWAVFAAGLSCFSLLGLSLSTMARPHAPAAALMTLALAAILELRRRGTTGSYWRAGMWSGLAVGTLHNALAVLLAGAAALLARRGSVRGLLERRSWIPLGCVCFCLACFWPFLLLGQAVVDPGSLSAARSPLRVGSEMVHWHEFDGSGTWAVAHTLASFEPLSAALACGALAAWLGSAWKNERWPRPSAAAFVLACFVVPYALSICAYNQTSQRFVLPLVPVLGCLASWGLWRLSLRSRPLRHVALALVALSVGVPAYAGSRWLGLRRKPDTLAQAAAWLSENVDGATQRVGIHCAYDLPLARRDEGLFGADGANLREVYSPWGRYQQQLLRALPSWPGERWTLVSLHEPRAIQGLRSDTDLARYYHGFDLDYAIFPAASETRASLVLQKLRNFVSSEAPLAQRFPDSFSRPDCIGNAGENSSCFLLDALTRDRLGPPIEIFGPWRELPGLVEDGLGPEAKLETKPGVHRRDGELGQ